MTPEERDVLDKIVRYDSLGGCLLSEQQMPTAERLRERGLVVDRWVRVIGCDTRRWFPTSEGKQAWGMPS